MVFPFDPLCMDDFSLLLVYSKWHACAMHISHRPGQIMDGATPQSFIVRGYDKPVYMTTYPYT